MRSTFASKQTKEMYLFSTKRFCSRNFSQQCNNSTFIKQVITSIPWVFRYTSNRIAPLSIAGHCSCYFCVVDISQRVNRDQCYFLFQTAIVGYLDEIYRQPNYEFGLVEICSLVRKLCPFPNRSRKTGLIILRSTKFVSNGSKCYCLDE